MTRRDLGLALVLAAVVTGPAWMHGYAGAAGAETYGHAWVRWWAAEQWPAWPLGTDRALHTRAWPVIDPLPTWLLGGVARLSSDRFAWNLGASLGVFGAALGGAALARALGGVAAVGAVGTALMPIWLGSMASGLTEDAAIGLVAGALALGLSGRWLGAGLSAGLAACCGLYLGWFAGLGLVAIALSRPRQWRGWVLGGLLAAALAIPPAWAFRSRLGGEGHRNAAPVDRPEPLWRVNPWFGADLASFWTPGRPALGEAVVRRHPTWLGYGTLGLALSAGWSPAWLGIAACVAVAPGERLSWAGQPLGLENPAAKLLDLLPFGARLNHHARVMLLGQLLLVGLAARGARRWPRAATVAVLVDAAMSPAELPLPWISPASPSIYAELGRLPEGPVLVVGEKNPQKPFFDQRAHGRALAMDPNRPGAGRPRPGTVLVVFDGPGPPGEPAVRSAEAAAWVLGEGEPLRDERRGE